MADLKGGRGGAPLEFRRERAALSQSDRWRRHRGSVRERNGRAYFLRRNARGVICWIVRRLWRAPELGRLTRWATLPDDQERRADG